MRRSEVTTVAESETARAAQAIGVLGPLSMAGWDDEAVLVIGNGQIAVHLFDLRDGQAGLREYLAPITVPKLALSVVDAHREHPLQCRNHRGLRARGQQVGEIAYRNAQRANVRQLSGQVDRARVGMRLDR